MIKINNELKQLINEWDNDFKGDLMESIEKDIDKDIDNGANLKESIGIITNECFPVWIKEVEGDTETINLYKEYQDKFKKVYNNL